MKIYPVKTGNFKLERGGQWFGVVPKTNFGRKQHPAGIQIIFIDIAARSL